MSGTTLAEASINSSEFYPAEVESGSNVQYIRDEDARKPDPAWEYTDANGHFHAFAGDGETPTLKTRSVYVECYGSCGGACGGEGYDETRWNCAICGEEVEPRFIPDEDVRYRGIPVETLRWSKVVVRGAGPLPPIGQQDNGNGTFTLDSRPAQVSVRIRADEAELIGTGYAALLMTYRAGRAEWTVVIEGAPLLPRLLADREQVS